MQLRYLILCAIFLIGVGTATDVPFVYNDSFWSIANYSSNEIYDISASSSDLIGVPMESSPGGLDDQEEFDAKIEPDNIIVREEVSRIETVYTGRPSIEDICSLFEHLRNGDNTTNGWNYINDPRGLNWAYANESLQIGRATGYVGAGDCDDFAIVMSALVESMGGTSRIVRGINPDVSHAFVEVYLGQDNGQDSDFNAIMEYIMYSFDAEKIYTHVDGDTKDVWLNLDWWANHPGGPFYKADEYMIYNNRNQSRMTRLRLSLPEWIKDDPESDYRPEGYVRGIHPIFGIGFVPDPRIS